LAEGSCSPVRKIHTPRIPITPPPGIPLSHTPRGVTARRMDACTIDGGCLKPTSLVNVGEADAAAAHVMRLLRAGVPPTSIAVQSPYSAQVTEPVSRPAVLAYVARSPQDPPYPASCEASGLGLHVCVDGQSLRWC
jgi:hypothetical protein